MISTEEIKRLAAAIVQSIRDDSEHGGIVPRYVFKVSDLEGTVDSADYFNEAGVPMDLDSYVAVRNEVDRQLRPVIYIATLNTGHYEFTATGETDKEARASLAAAWQIHAEQTGADPDYLNGAFGDEINVISGHIGQTFRDYSPIGDVYDGRGAE